MKRGAGTDGVFNTDGVLYRVNRARIGVGMKPRLTIDRIEGATGNATPVMYLTEKGMRQLHDEIGRLLERLR